MVGAFLGGTLSSAVRSMASVASPLLEERKASANAVVVTHWPMFERVLDAMWVALLVAGSISMLSSGDQIDGSTAAVCIIVGCILAGLLIARVSRREFTVDGDTVTVVPYRVLGLVRMKEFTVARSAIGTLVFDTERRCCGLRGFIGVYATLGLPQNGAPLNIAFEIPMIYNSWSRLTEDCFISSHRATFFALERALRFRRLGRVKYEETPAVTTIVSGGTWADHHMVMVDNMMNENLASLNSYESYAGLNPDLLPARFTWERDSYSGRTVFYISASA